jgi:hypothetical protein
MKVYLLVVHLSTVSDIRNVTFESNDGLRSQILKLGQS